MKSKMSTLIISIINMFCSKYVLAFLHGFFPPAEIVICFYFGNRRGKNRKICNVCKIVF